MKQPPPETVAQITRRLRRLGCPPEIVARHVAELAKARRIPRKVIIRLSGPEGPELTCITTQQLRKIRERQANIMVWNQTP